ncbi:MAG: glutaredoxin [bacterium]|nr:glutaredoxin [bacterium]
MGKNAKNVTIFTTNTCAYCVMVKRWLKSKGVNYSEVNLDEFPDRQQEALEISGALTVPVTVVTKFDDSKSVVVGYNLAQLAPALS